MDSPVSKSHAEKARQQFIGDVDREYSATVKARQHTGRAFTVRFRFKDGRKPMGVAWAMFNDFEFTDAKWDGKPCEKLVLFFAPRYIELTGLFLEKVLDDIETERTFIVRELDSVSAGKTISRNEEAMLGSESGDLLPEAVKPVVFKIEYHPTLQERIAQMTIRREDNGFENG